MRFTRSKVAADRPAKAGRRASLVSPTVSRYSSSYSVPGFRAGPGKGPAVHLHPQHEADRPRHERYAQAYDGKMVQAEQTQGGFTPTLHGTSSSHGANNACWRRLSVAFSATPLDTRKDPGAAGLPGLFSSTAACCLTPPTRSGGDGAFRCGADGLRVFREDAAFNPDRRLLPGRSTRLQLLVGKVHRDDALVRVDRDGVPVP